MTDNGIGLDTKMKKRIFERFVRGHGEEVRQRRGTGIGLYVVASLVKTLGGRVWAESPGLGRGSTMTVELPGP